MCIDLLKNNLDGQPKLEHGKSKCDVNPQTSGRHCYDKGVPDATLKVLIFNCFDWVCNYHQKHKHIGDGV